MSTLTEIQEALPKLSTRELQQLASALDRLFRERKGTSIYDDSYGTYTEVDLILCSEKAFLEYDREEEEHAKRRKG